MKKFMSFLITLFYLLNCFSQNRNNTWCFGEHCGLDFTTSPPTPFSDPAIFQLEGSASISDNITGQLLFYSDGVSVWNRNHQVMLNGTGLFGHESSTQSALIVPLPGSNTLYYIFTAPVANLHPLSYSIIDMTLDGGLGAVTAAKNVALHNPVMEKLTGALKSNGTDYWIVAKEFGTNAFLAYSLTSAGIDTNAVISSTGLASVSIQDLGYARISPDGTKLCIAYQATGMSQLLDFDNSTGLISNPADLVSPIAFPASKPYGVEFSPDNSKLYIMDYYECALWQYDLLAGSPTDIQNSAVLVGHSGFPEVGSAIQLAPDNKIYITSFHRYYLSVVNQPDSAATACNYVFAAITVAPGSRCGLGLPNNINFSNVIACPPALITASNVTICSNQSYQLPSGTIVSIAGIYQDTVRSQPGFCDSIITTLNLSVAPVSFLNTEAHICSNQSYQLPTGTIVSAEGTYLDTLRNLASCDSIINTIHLSVNDISLITQVDSISAGQTYELPSGVAVSAAGTYQSTFTNSLGCDSVITTVLKIKQSIAGCLVLKNAFSPNSDGINDEWILYQGNCFKKLEVNVYSRYGSLVYHADDYKNDWDGKYRNKTVPDGTYYYIIKVISFDDREQVFKDNVTILR